MACAVRFRLRILTPVYGICKVSTKNSYKCNNNVILIQYIFLLQIFRATKYKNKSKYSFFDGLTYLHIVVVVVFFQGGKKKSVCRAMSKVSSCI